MMNDERCSKSKRQRHGRVTTASDYVIRISFELRHSSFVISSGPHLRLSQLPQQQLLERGAGAGRKIVDAAALAELTQTLEIILHRLLIGLHPVAAKCDLLHGAGFGVHE